MKDISPRNTHVYILECADKTLYTGCAINLEKRIREHNESRAGARYTRGRRPVKLVYVELYSSHSKALRREAEIRKFSRTQKLLLINGTLDQIDVESPLLPCH